MVYSPDQPKQTIPMAPAQDSQSKSADSLVAEKERMLKEAAKRAQELGLAPFPTGDQEEEG